MYHKILVAVDGSANSLRAAQEALKVGAEEIVLLSVITPEDSKNTVLHKELTSEDERMLKLQDVVNLYERQNVNYTLKLEHGTPKERIIQHANSSDYDMLILGSRGLNALQEMTLGSVSHKVVKKSEIPVLVVK